MSNPFIFHMMMCGNKSVIELRSEDCNFLLAARSISAKNPTISHVKTVLLAWYANPSAKKYHVVNSNYSLQKRIKKTHYSNSLIFVQTFNFDQNFTLRHILEYFILLKRINSCILVHILTQNWIKKNQN